MITGYHRSQSLATSCLTRASGTLLHPRAKKGVDRVKELGRPRSVVEVVEREAMRLDYHTLEHLVIHDGTGNLTVFHTSVVDDLIRFADAWELKFILPVVTVAICIYPLRRSTVSGVFLAAFCCFMFAAFGSICFSS